MESAVKQKKKTTQKRWHMRMKLKGTTMNKLFLVLALLFALSACTATIGKKCTYTQEGTKISSWVWIYTDGKPIDIDKDNCN